MLAGSKLRVRVLQNAQDAADWNARQIDILLAHPASCAYGLNLQQGGNHVVWFGLNWSLELYQQANKRLHRQGQTATVFVHHLAVTGTRDDDVLAALQDKNATQDALIDSLKAQGATINSWGVGTNLITSKDCPAFGGVYKLAAIKDKDDEDFVPKIKLSENTEKITNPGNKTIYRIYDKATGKIRADLICMVNETFDESKDMIIFDPIETWKKTKIKGGTYTLRELLVPVFQKGLCVYTSPSVMEMQAICKKEQETLWPETRRLVNPQKVYVDLSDKLYHIKSDLLEEMSMKALGEQ